MQISNLDQGRQTYGPKPARLDVQSGRLRNFKNKKNTQILYLSYIKYE